MEVRTAIGVAVLACGVAGCSQPPARRPGPPPGIDPWARDGGIADASGTGRTLTFAFSSVEIDRTPFDETTPIAGFDFDRLYSVNSDGTHPDTPFSCDKQDAPSVIDIDSNCPVARWDPATGLCAAPGCDPRREPCRGGVDNQFPGLSDAIEAISFVGLGIEYRPFVQRIFAQGHAAMIVQVHDVDSLADDPFVRVSLVRAVPDFGAPCDSSVDGQRYVALRSAVVGDNPQRAVVNSSVAWIQGGRLRARFEGTVAFPFADWVPGIWVWPIERLQFAVDLREERGVQGHFGAVISAQRVLDHVLPMADMYAPQIVGGFVDVERMGVCRAANGSGVMGDIGIGFGFELTRATLSDGVADGPRAGACPTEPLVIVRGDGGVEGGVDGGDAGR